MSEINKWPCSRCSYKNVPSKSKCEMCDTSRDAKKPQQNKDHQEVKQFLKKINLEIAGLYYDKFIDNGISSMDAIKLMEKQDLKEMNVLIGHRLLIHNHIQQYIKSLQHEEMEVDHEEEEKDEQEESLPTKSKSNIRYRKRKTMDSDNEYDERQPKWKKQKPSPSNTNNRHNMLHSDSDEDGMDSSNNHKTQKFDIFLHRLPSDIV